MTFVTLAVGPTWKMELLRGLLEERGLTALLFSDDNAFLQPTPRAAQSARLDVPGDVLDLARSIVTEAREEGSLALEGLRYVRHERPSKPPRRVRALLLDVGFWLALFLIVFLIFSWLFF